VIDMSIGLGIVLIVIGAILTFALNFSVDWVDLDLIGWILMVAGAIVVIIGLVLLATRRSRRVVDDGTVVREERDDVV